MAYVDFKIGSQPIMANQPSHINHRKKGLRKIRRLVDGSYVGSNRDKGEVVVVTWGIPGGVPTTAAYSELLADLGAENSTFTLAFEDPAGNTVSVDVVAEEIDRKYGPGQLFEPFTVTFFETA